MTYRMGLQRQLPHRQRILTYASDRDGAPSVEQVYYSQESTLYPEMSQAWKRQENSGQFRVSSV